MPNMHLFTCACMLLVRYGLLLSTCITAVECTDFRPDTLPDVVHYLYHSWWAVTLSFLHFFSLFVAKMRTNVFRVPFWSKPPFLIFDIWHLTLTECRLVRMSKIKNSGLDQYGTLKTLKCNHLAPLTLKG